MGQVITSASMSLEGYLATGDTLGRLPTVCIQGNPVTHLLFPLAERVKA